MLVRGRSLEKLLQNLLHWSGWQKLPLLGLWVENSRQDSDGLGFFLKKVIPLEPKPNVALSISLWLVLFLARLVLASMSLCFFPILAYLVSPVNPTELIGSIPRSFGLFWENK